MSRLDRMGPKRLVHLSYQCVHVFTTGTFYYYRPCYGQPNCPDGGDITFDTETVTCPVCKKTELYREMLIEYELGDKNLGKYNEMVHKRLMENTINVLDEEERLKLPQFDADPTTF